MDLLFSAATCHYLGSAYGKSTYLHPLVLDERDHGSIAAETIGSHLFCLCCTHADSHLLGFATSCLFTDMHPQQITKQLGRFPERHERSQVNQVFLLTRSQS